MKLDKVLFQGIAVGVQLTAESEEEQRLLWALRKVLADVDETYGMQMPHALFLTPALPWKNQTDRPTQ